MCCVSTVTFRNTCPWTLISSHPSFFILNGCNQELLHGQTAQRKHLTYFLFLKLLMLRSTEEQCISAWRNSLMLNLFPTCAGEPSLGLVTPPSKSPLCGRAWSEFHIPLSHQHQNPLPESVPVSLLGVSGSSLCFLGVILTLVRAGWWPPNPWEGWTSTFALGCRHLRNNFNCQPVKSPVENKCQSSCT